MYKTAWWRQNFAKSEFHSYDRISHCVERLYLWAYKKKRKKNHVIFFKLSLISWRIQIRKQQSGKSKLWSKTKIQYRSQTTLTSFWPFLTTYPPSFTVSTLWKLTFLDCLLLPTFSCKHSLWTILSTVDTLTLFTCPLGIASRDFSLLMLWPPCY